MEKRFPFVVLVVLVATSSATHENQSSPSSSSIGQFTCTEEQTIRAQMEQIECRQKKEQELEERLKETNDLRKALCPTVHQDISECTEPIHRCYSDDLYQLILDSSVEQFRNEYLAKGVDINTCNDDNNNDDGTVNTNSTNVN